jgi:hypothetical protein
MQHIHIVTSRFNTDTWNENCAYRKKIYDYEHDVERVNETYFGTKCIYGSPQKITEKIGNNELVFVVEMNNTTNKIEGIGLIRNHVLDKKDNNFYYRLYKNGNYNRYVYKSAYHLDRRTLEGLNEKLVSILDVICFKGKTHLKRGSGITRIPDKLYQHKLCEDFNVKSTLREIFKTFYSQNT